ncbi:hypothetical protein BKP44_07295 [Formosa algae]|nr:hypothetical protein BKP44_07295 [Formosa algae]
MNKLKIILLFTIVFLSCKKENDITKMQFLTDNIPSHIPFEFKQNLVPENKLIHKGIFSPDLNEYYYTISDSNFEKFEVFVIKKIAGNGLNQRKLSSAVHITNTE